MFLHETYLWFTHEIRHILHFSSKDWNTSLNLYKYVNIQDELYLQLWHSIKSKIAQQLNNVVCINIATLKVSFISKEEFVNLKAKEKILE